MDELKISIAHIVTRQVTFVATRKEKKSQIV